jgi:membrane protein insertase Oxa1/YidC/SpoIIIJ
MGTLMFIPMGAYLPAALPLLWTVNTFFGVFQAQLFRNPSIRSRLNLPPLPAKPVVPSILSPEQGAAAEAAAVAAASQAAAAAASLKPPPPGQGPFRALHKPNLKPGAKKPAPYVKPSKA